MNAQHRKFASEYVRNGFNGVQAVFSAGYIQGYNSACVQASRLLRNPQVQRLIQRELSALKRHDDPKVVELASYLKEHQRLPKRKQPQGFIYVVQADNGLIKIGKATNWQSRLDRINTALPYDTAVLLIFRSSEYSLLELKLHRVFDSKRIRGEWFALSAEDIQSIPTLIGTFSHSAEQIA